MFSKSSDAQEHEVMLDHVWIIVGSNWAVGTLALCRILEVEVEVEAAGCHVFDVAFGVAFKVRLEVTIGVAFGGGVGVGWGVTNNGIIKRRRGTCPVGSTGFN